jgi:hypothetical protein
VDPLLTALLGAMEKGGPWAVAIVFAIGWWLERTERKENTGLLLKMVPDMIAATKDVKAAIDMLRVAVGGKGGE